LYHTCLIIIRYDKKYLVFVFQKQKFSKGDLVVNRKNMIVASKLALLLVLLGFCLPLCDESNGFQSAVYFLNEMGSGIFTAVGWALLAMFAAAAASIIYSLVIHVLLKKEYFRAEIAVDIILFIIQVVCGIFAFTVIKNVPEEEIELAFGYYVILIGWLGFLVLYMYSSVLNPNLSTKAEEHRSYWMLALPAIIFYFGVMTFPALFSIILSLTNYGGGELFRKRRGEFCRA